MIIAVKHIHLSSAYGIEYGMKRLSGFLSPKNSKSKNNGIIKAITKNLIYLALPFLNGFRKVNIKSSGIRICVSKITLLTYTCTGITSLHSIEIALLTFSSLVPK